MSQSGGSARDEAVRHRPPLGAHRLLGQGRGAALVRPNGEVDWWCPNRFEATPVLWSLLDPNGGASRWLDVELASWDGAPAGPTAHSRLRQGQNRIDTWDGLITVGTSTVLVRLVRCTDQIELVHELRCGGFDEPLRTWEIDVDGAGSGDLRVCILGPSDGHVLHHDQTTLHTRLQLQPGLWTGVMVSAGPMETLYIADVVAMMRDAEQDEAEYLDHVQLPRAHPSRAVDALRVMRVLTDPETGAPIASPTTSLPEDPGGQRQFDYRYSWLRDSAHAAATAALIGRSRTSATYFEFVHRLLERQSDQIVPMTETSGDPVPDEREVEGVAGWAGSVPVRVGNAASAQTQLDSLSTVLESIVVHIQCGGRMSPTIWSIVDRLADALVDAPVGPSSGIWELREPKHLVTDELARWIGLDKAIRIKRVLRPWLRRPEWVAARAAARDRVMAAIDPATGMLPQSFEGPFVADAATLLACLNGFFPARGEQVTRLVAATISTLEEGWFLRRYHSGTDDFDGVEGAFVPASWWAVSALAAIGDYHGAKQRADEMCSHLPPLQPEEWWVENDEALGNTPLLWSHTEAARALYNLNCARIAHRYGHTGLRVWRILRYVRLRFFGDR